MRVKARRLARNLVFTLAMLLLTLGVIEGMAHLTHRVLFNQSATSPVDIDRLGRRFGPLWRSPTTGTEQGQQGHVAAVLLHPFYGYVGGRHPAPLDDMPPQERRKGALMVGLFGGSVAKDVVGEFRNALLQHFLELKTGAVPILADLSEGGYHQPQQAVVLANMMANGAQFDVVVLLDGYNEVTGPTQQARSDFHPAFPGLWFSLVSMSAQQAEIVRHLLELRDEEQSLRRQLDTESVLRKSAVFRVVWGFLLARVERRIVLRHQELASPAMTEYRLEKYGPRENYTEDYRRTMGPRFWYDASLLIAGLAERHGAEHYHFIQPNQYVPNSKPFSADELAIFDQAFSQGGEHYSKPVLDGYGQMREYGHLLREHGVHLFDLSWIFQDRPETLYRDFCCHFNKRGNELLAAAMLQRIVGESSLLARPSLEGGGPPASLAESTFDIYHLGNALGYVKAPCSSADTQATFFLHVSPVHEDDLPRHRLQHGFDNLDFQFARVGTVFGDRCVATVPLPNYPVARVRTGQGGHEGAAAWTVEFSP